MSGYRAPKIERWRVGWVVFGVLMVLTVVEFGVSVGLTNRLPWLTVIALVKAGVIVVYFMRVSDLGVVWRKEVGK